MMMEIIQSLNHTWKVRNVVTDVYTPTRRPIHGKTIYIIIVILIILWL